MRKVDMDVSPISGVEPWERRDWTPGGDDLPDWLAELRAQHVAAVDEFEKSVAANIDTKASIEDEGRAWRRAVRDAVASGTKPPARDFDPEVSAARVLIAEEDAEAARVELAAVAVSILAELRQRREDFAEHFASASQALRYALGAGPEGLVREAVADLKARQAALEAEDAITDLSKPNLNFEGEELPANAVTA
jgi:hypothetical protein